MGDKFGDRVRGAMLAAGMETPAQLGRRCGFSRQAAEKWLRASKPQLSAAHLFGLARCLKVRMTWLMTGAGVTGWGLQAREIDLERAVTILEHLTPAKTQTWLKAGQRMAGK